MYQWEETAGIHKKEDVASPTVSLKAIIITFAIESHKVTDVDTIDIPVAYIHMESDENVMMIFKGILEELLLSIYHKLYRK